MSPLIRYYPGDQGLDVLLVVTLGVALASSAAWLIARRLAGQAALRHLVLFSALIGCLALPAVAWFGAAQGFTLVSIPLVGGEQERIAASVVAQLGTDPVEAPPRPATDPSPVAAAPLSPRTAPTIDETRDVAVAPAANQIPATPAPSAPEVQRIGNPAATRLSFREFATGAMLIWAAGAVLALARLARNCGRVVQLRRSSRPVRNERLRILLQEVTARLGSRREPLLLASSRTVTPLAVGFGRPAIVLPERLLGAVSDDELRDVLMHEAAHLQRGDQRIVLLQELAGALYWPIVSVHALNRELQRAREEVCDNVVLAGRDAISYGETLLHVAELVVQARPMGAAVGIIGGHGELKRRIAGLIDPRRSTKTTTGRKSACVVTLLFLAICAIASATRFAASAAAAPSAEAVAAEVAPPPLQEMADPATAQDPEDPDDPRFAGRFSGQVTGPDGKPVKGARVFDAPLSDGLDGQLSNEPSDEADGGALPVLAETDADGRFEFDAPNMTLTDLDGLPTRRVSVVIATADGYGPDWIGVRGRTRSSIIRHPVKGTDLALRLTDDVPIRGRFLDADGQPLAGARVRLNALFIPKGRDLGAYLEQESKTSQDKYFLSSGPSYERSLFRPRLLPGLTPETHTDADGRFTLSGLGRDRLAMLGVSAPSVVDAHLSVMTREAPDVGILVDSQGKPSQVIYGAGFTLPLKRGRTISGVVRDRDTHEPIPGMQVGMGREDYPRDGVWNHQTVTDAKGQFRITGLDPSNDRWSLTAASAPGMSYQSASVTVEGDAPVVIECQRGIPFRLKLIDEQGQPAEADVAYFEVLPNPFAPKLYNAPSYNPISQALRKPDGTYEGFVLPGPGAVLVRTPDRLDYRPASVDPLAFFAPDGSDADASKSSGDYGTRETVHTVMGATKQNDYAAIVLVNPPPDSPALELSATVAQGTQRRVSLIDPEGMPLTGVQTQGMTSPLYDYEPPLRAASFALDKLHPDRVRRILFREDERQLIGFLAARGDGEAPYVVRMQPWAAVTGRIVDEHGDALPIEKPESDWKAPPKFWADFENDPDADHRLYAEADSEGRFRVDQLIPGQRYNAHVYLDQAPWVDAEMAFEGVVLSPGEVRDLGDVRTKLIYDPEYKQPAPEDQATTANVPDEAWGEPVDGLRAAIVLKSPAVDEHDRLRYDIVAENVSDHDIRFGAADNFEFSYYKIKLVDADGNEAPRQPGSLPKVETPSRVHRCRLKPQERMVISPCDTKLVRLDEAGQPLPSSTPDRYEHFVGVKPRRYSISAALELGSGETYDYAAEVRHELPFAAPGEWTGTLQTGVASAALFEDADNASRNAASRD